MTKELADIDWDAWVSGCVGKTEEELQAARTAFALEISGVFYANPLGPMVVLHGALGAIASVVALSTTKGDYTLVRHYAKIFDELLIHTAMLAQYYTSQPSSPPN